MKIDLKYAVINIEDGSMSPNILEIRVGEGTLAWTEKRTVEYVKNRGLLDTVRLGDQEPVDVRFDFIWEHLKSVSTDATISTDPTQDPEVPSVYEALKGTGAASSWVSAGSNPCEPYAVNIVVVYTPPCSGDKAETITIREFRYEQLALDAKAGTVNVTGKANVTAPTMVRAS